MNQLLSKDQDELERCFPEARIFLHAAGLRYEAFVLFNDKHRSRWQEDKLVEIIKAPACQVAWFQKIINTKQ